MRSAYTGSGLGVVPDDNPPSGRNDGVWSIGGGCTDDECSVVTWYLVPVQYLVHT